jgi:TolB-like protein
MSGNPECFADGISEDIITALSKVSQLFVIARNSAVTLKGRNVLVAGLGVRHVQIGTQGQDHPRSSSTTTAGVHPELCPRPHHARHR